jgi:predicted phage terminase large subunit-like protein
MEEKIDKNDIVSFVMEALATIDPQTKYVHNWHVEIICEYLEKIYRSEIKRLIINVPPRSLKSVCVNVAFPAWILANRPSEKIISASYSQSLALKHSSDCRKIMESDWYQDSFKTRLLKGENEKRKFVTTKNGYRFSTSVGGTLTGEGGNFIIVDDPQNPAKIHSKKEQEKLFNWFDSVLMSRLNDKKNGRIVIVMQRLHQNDLTAYLLGKKSSQWNVLSIPSIECNERLYRLNGKIYQANSNGILLHEDRDSRAFVDQSRAELGTFAFAAQYQQNPIQPNSLINPEWIVSIDKFPEFESVYYSVDTASSIKDTADFTAILKIGVCENKFYITEIIHKKLEYVDLKKEILNLSKNNPEATFLIEEKSVGASLIGELKSQTLSKIISILPTKDKTTRVLGVISLMESKRVFIKNDLINKAEFLIELAAFPNAVHDDQVDALSQFLNHIKSVDNVKKKRLPRMMMI